MNSAAEGTAGGEGAATAAWPPGRGLQLRRSAAVSGNEPEPEPGREQDVVAHVYDVACSGPDGNGGGGATVLHINRIFKDAIGLDGIFHTAIQVYGDEEWSFGYCENGSGVFSCPLGKNPMYTFRESIVLGRRAALSSWSPSYCPCLQSLNPEKTVGFRSKIAEDNEQLGGAAANGCDHQQKARTLGNMLQQVHQMTDTSAAEARAGKDIQEPNLFALRLLRGFTDFRSGKANCMQDKTPRSGLISDRPRAQFTRPPIGHVMDQISKSIQPAHTYTLAPLEGGVFLWVPLRLRPLPIEEPIAI
ncbi:hypothetical protein D1007_28867 [Hordeum vulgare]|nr:hypothetical protein D1007_28867 [Hordeum vulgare]